MAEKKAEKKVEKKAEKAEKKVTKKAEKKVTKKAEKKERKPSNLRKDHIKVLEFLSKELPKRTAFSMTDIAKGKFKDGPNITADRVARNSVRKPRQMELVEICERGEYRLTPAGAAFCKNLKEYEVAPDMERETKPAKKKAEKKGAAHKVAKPAKTSKSAKAKTEKSAKTSKPAKGKNTKTKRSDPDFPDDDDEVTTKSGKNTKSEPAAPLPSDEEEPASAEA